MLRIMLILWLISIPRCPVALTIRLVIAQPPGEVVGSTDMQTAMSAVIDAASFWHDRAPFPVAMPIGSTEIMTTTARVYDTTEWAAGLATDDPNRITIVLIDNRDGAGTLRNGRMGWSQPWNGLAVVLLYHSVGHHAIPAAIAHEIGHVVFNLPDLYDVPGACDRADIMCYPVAAYNTPTIGCVSLARLGYPCKRMYLPR